MAELPIEGNRLVPKLSVVMWCVLKIQRGTFEIASSVSQPN
jgi:hypothetical protein